MVTIINNTPVACNHQPTKDGPCKCWRNWLISLHTGQVDEKGEPQVLRIVRYAPGIVEALKCAYEGMFEPIEIRPATEEEAYNRSNM